MVMALLLESFLMLGVYVVSHSVVALCVTCCERDRVAAFFTSSSHCVSSLWGVVFSCDGGGSEGGLS